MKIAIKDIQGKSQGEVTLGFPPVEADKGAQAVHDVVVAYQAAQRSGTAHTKTMGEVAGTGKKPWRQKGTGRARAGSFASPLWVGGGVVFGPKPRSYRERANAGDVVVVDDIKLDGPKTKGFVGVLNALEINGSALVVADNKNQNLVLATRNVPNVELTNAESVNTYQLLRYKKVLFTRGALESLDKRLQND
jgi:large subunit ribosomal protein L4